MSNLSNVDPRQSNATNNVNYQHLYPYNVYQQNTVYPFNHYAMQISQHQPQPFFPYQHIIQPKPPLLPKPFSPPQKNGGNVRNDIANHQRPIEHHQSMLECPQPLPLPNTKSSLSNLTQFLDTHDIIQWPLSNELIALKTIYENQNRKWHKKFAKAATSINAIYRIGKYLWLRAKGTSEYHKIKAKTHKEWMEWIPTQNPKHIKSWKRYTALDSAEHGFDKIGFKDSNGDYCLLKHMISKYNRERLIQFIIAIKTLYQNEINNHHKGPKKACWKCGKMGSHTAKECHAHKDIHGNNVNHRSPVSRSQLCRYGVKCNRRVCPFLHKHQMQCRYGTECTVTNCEFMHSKSKKRKLDYIAQDNINDRPIKKRRRDEKKIKIEKEMMNGGIMISDITVSNIKTESGEKVMLSCTNCNADLRNGDVWRCSSCKVVYYCGKTCQSTHWRIHKLECGNGIQKTVNVKIERVPVNDWNCYAIIYWFNTLFKDVKYIDLKKHIVMGKIRGSDLLSINTVMLRMMGIYDHKEQQMILSAMSDVVSGNDFNNVFANVMNIDSIPHGFLDPVLYELMEEPVRVKQSGYIYDKSFITKYIIENKSDPITGKCVDLKNIEQCGELKKEIAYWTNKYLNRA